MSEPSELTGLTDDELLARLTALRERRSKASERRRVERTVGKAKKTRGAVEIDDTLGALLDELLGDDEWGQNEKTN